MSALLEVKNLKKYFKTARGTLHAVDDVSFTVDKGCTLGIVGESGCGKSTMGRAIVQLHDPTAGQILFDGRDVTHLKKKEFKAYNRDVQMIFQDYPHELDGGRRQRIGIARALALEPQFIVCDEPVSALDVSIQAQILNLMMDLQEEKKLTYMFITHDLSVVKHISDHIGVMYLGKLVEKCETRELFKNQLHPYTKALLSAIPRIDIDNPSKRTILRGEITSPIDPKPGCRFAPRCPYATKACFEQDPELRELAPGHFVSCHRVEEIRNGTAEAIHA